MSALDFQNDFERNKFVPFATAGREVYHTLTANSVVDGRARTAPALREVRDTVKMAGFWR